MKSLPKKRKIFVAILVTLIFIAVPSIVYAYDMYNYMKHYKLAEKALADERFDEAIAYLQRSQEYYNRNRENTEELMEQASLLKEAGTKYQQGLQLQKEKKYLEAVEVFKKIPIGDNRYFNEGQRSIQICIGEHISSIIAKAKAEADNKNYDSAINLLNSVLEIDTEQQEAKLLKEQYAGLILEIKQAEEARKIAEAKAKAEAETKAKEEAKLKAEKQAAQAKLKEVANNQTKTPTQSAKDSDYKLLYKTNKHGNLRVNATLNPNFIEYISYPIWDLEIYIKDSKINVNIKNVDVIRLLSLNYYITVTSIDTGAVLYKYVPQNQ